MKWVNKYGMSDQMARAVEEANKDYRTLPENTVSVTEAIAPTRISILTRRHDADIVEDVSDGVWRLLGKAVHYIVQKAEGETDLAEIELGLPIAYINDAMWSVSGMSDLREENGDIRDFKVTSVWKFLLGDTIDWEAQLNYYEALYRSLRFESGVLWIEAIIRDWSPTEYLRYSKRGYPPVNYLLVKVEKWAAGKAEEHMAERVALFVAHLEVPDEELPLCTERERWYRGGKFGLKKKANKTFSGGRKLDSLEEAIKYAEEKKIGVRAADGSLKLTDSKWEFIPIEGTYARCESEHPVYCPVRQWCSFYKELKERSQVGSKSDAGNGDSDKG